MLAKVNKLIVFILTLCNYNAQSQNIYFDKLYDFGNANNYADGSGGIINGIDSDEYYFIARTINLNTNISTGVLCKIDEYGDTILTVKITDVNKSYIPTALVKTSDNSITIASTVTNIVTNKRDYSLTKINSANEIEVVKTYGDSINNEQALHVISTFDKGFLIVGQSVVPPNDSADMYVVKTDSAGNFEWEKYYGGSNFEAAYSVIQSPDTGYIILGWTQSFGNGQQDWYLVKTDKFGNQQWQKTYGSSEVDIATSITSIIDGSYLISGVSGGGGASIGRVRKIDSLGTVIWSKSYKHENNPTNDIWKTLELSNGDIVSTGMTDETDNAGWLIKTDMAGNKLWSRMYNNNANIDLFYDFTTTADGGFLLAGLAWNANNNSQDAWLLKVDSVGCEYENCLVGIDEESKKVVVDIYPNPASDVLNIELQEAGKKYEIQLVDIQGQLVYKSEVRNQKSEINISSLANGIYLLTLQNAEQKTSVKIIVQH